MEGFKRKKIFNYLHQKEFDIIFLQETHSTKRNEKFWRSNWGGRMYFSHGEGNARGVATLIKKKTTIKILNSYKDSQGRCLALEIKYENLKFTLVNLYAPNEDKPEFFVSQFREIKEKITTDNIKIGGDFNLVLDLDRDKIGGQYKTNSKAQQKVKEFMMEQELVDIWRVKHPQEKVLHGIENLH